MPDLAASSQFNLLGFAEIARHAERERERERESFYIRVPSPAGLIGWNIQHNHNRPTWQHVQQRHYGHERLTNVAIYYTSSILVQAVQYGILIQTVQAQVGLSLLW